MSAKWGIFGRSFNDIGTVISAKISTINKNFQATDDLIGSIKNSGDSIWKRFYPSKESIKSQIIDVDSLFPKQDDSYFSLKLNELVSFNQKVQDVSKSWQDYFKNLSESEKWQIEFVQNTDLQKASLDDVKGAYNNAREAAIAHNTALQQQTLGAKAATVALEGLKLVGNMIAMWAISEVISGLYKLSQVSEDVAESAQELGNSFKSTSSDIDGYKSQIEELYKTINDSSSSIEDITNARKSLISVQDELIDKFGTEKGVINDVTDAINGQTDALDSLSLAKWQEIKNEFNDGGFWNDISNSVGGYSDNIERMLDKYGDYHARIRLNDFINQDNLEQVDAFKALLKNKFDAKITFDISEGSEIAMLSGNASEIYEKLLDIQSVAEQFHFNNSFENKLTKLANSARETSDKYKDFYNQYILYKKILTDDSNYADTFKDITDAYEEYKDAFTTGDESKIKETSDEYAEIVATAMDNAIANGDSDIATYFENMYPTLQSVVDRWKFNLAFDADTDELQNKVQSVLDKCKDENGRDLTAEEILGLGEANQQYQDLLSIADSYNMSIAEMLELLKERNLTRCAR